MHVVGAQPQFIVCGCARAHGASTNACTAGRRFVTGVRGIGGQWAVGSPYLPDQAH